MGMLDKVEMVRKMCPVIFLLDTSGSMDGSPIGAVNDAIRNVLPELISMNDDNPDTEIKVAIMTFDYGAEWATGDTELLSPEEVQTRWENLEAQGYTSMGAAFKALNEKLSVTHGFMQRASGSVAPVLFLLSDGDPTDDYKSGLQELQNNKWYQVAVRVAVGYDNPPYSQSNDEILREFTGNEGTVLKASNPESLRNTIRFIAITSSRVASKGNGVTTDEENANPDDNTGTVADALKNQGGLNAALDIGDNF